MDTHTPHTRIHCWKGVKILTNKHTHTYIHPMYTDIDNKIMSNLILACSYISCYYVFNNSLPYRKNWIRSCFFQIREFVVTVAWCITCRSACHTFIWLETWLPWSSSWMLVIISLERTMVILRPLNAKAQFSRKTAALTSAGVVILIGALTSLVYALDFEVKSEVDSSTCVALANQNLVYRWLYMLFYTLFPALIIVTSVSADVYAIKYWHRMGIFRYLECSVHENAHNFTFMLFVNCAVFVLLTLPHSAYGLYLRRDTLKHHFDKQGNFDAFNAQVLVCDLMKILNHAINPFIYTFCGRVYRKEFFKLFYCFCNSPQNQRVRGSSQSASETVEVKLWSRLLKIDQVIQLINVEQLARNSDIDRIQILF